MTNKEKERPRYSHQFYEKDLKRHAEWSRLSDSGSLADMLAFKKKYAKEIKAEEEIVRNKKSNFQNDLDAGRLESNYVKPGVKKKVKPNASPLLGSALGFSVGGSTLLKTVQASKSAVKAKVSRKHAGPPISDPYLARLRIQSWYLTLLGNWFPDIAMALRDHMVFQTISRYYHSLGLELPDEIAQSLPVLPPDRNAGDLLEKEILKKFRTNPLLKNKRYNLKARNYMTGEGHVTDSTVIEFAQIVPESKSVYRLGFWDLPMWQIFDGDRKVCLDFALAYLGQDQVEAPGSYANYILGYLLDSKDQPHLASLIAGIDEHQYQHASELDKLLLVLGQSEFLDTDGYGLNPTGKRVACACLLLLALIQTTPADYVMAHKRLQLLLVYFYLSNLYQNSFGLVFHIFIRQRFLANI